MRAKKSLGQNFLRDQSIIKRIVDALDLRDNETVIEIGPGQGALTEQLLIYEANVIAIEFDRDMVSLLRDRFGSLQHFHLINDDALNVNFLDVLNRHAVDKQVKFVANLPYNISTPILQRLMDQRHLFTSLVLMFQREVVERITAKAGGKERGFLSVLVENAFDSEYLFDVPPQAFQPIPKVWSSVVRLTPKNSLIADEDLLRFFVSICFSQKRKNILNNLKTQIVDAASVLEKSGIAGNRRAETLSLKEWESLITVIRSGRTVKSPATLI